VASSTWDYVGGSAFAIAGCRQFAVATSSPYGQKNEIHYYVFGTAANAYIFHRTLRLNDDILGSYAEMIQAYNKARELYIDPVVDIQGNVASQDGSPPVLRRRKAGKDVHRIKYKYGGRGHYMQ
jgi:hypothetical protein